MRIAKRAASQGWDLERARTEIATLQRADVPAPSEIDEARDLIGSSEATFDLAVAIDLLIEAGFPGVPRDAEHNPGNVHYFLAFAWLDRVEAGELLAVEFVERHCQASRAFYSQFRPLVPGAHGHPAWADVLQCEAQLYWKLAGRRDTLSNLNKAAALFEEARPCYPPEDRYHPVLILEAMLLMELAEHENANGNLRKALEVIRAAVGCFDRGDPDLDHSLAAEMEIWQSLIRRDLTTPNDKGFLEAFVKQARYLTPQDTLAYEQITEMKRKFLKKTLPMGFPRH